MGENPMHQFDFPLNVIAPILTQPGGNCTHTVSTLTMTLKDYLSFVVEKRICNYLNYHPPWQLSMCTKDCKGKICLTKE